MNCVYLWNVQDRSLRVGPFLCRLSILRLSAQNDKLVFAFPPSDEGGGTCEARDGGRAQSAPIIFDFPTVGTAFVAVRLADREIHLPFFARICIFLNSPVF